MRTSIRTYAVFLVVGLPGSMLGYLVAIMCPGGRGIRMRTRKLSSIGSSHTHAHVHPLSPCWPCSWGPCPDHLAALLESSSDHVRAIWGPQALPACSSLSALTN